MTRPLARILIADPYAVMRRGVRLLVEDQSCYHVVGDVSDGIEALRVAKDTDPTIAVLEFALPQLGGVELIHQFRGLCPRTEILIHTDLNRECVILDALRAGAKGFVLKTDPADHLMAALNSLSLRLPYFSERVTEVLLDRFIQSKPDLMESCLTHREREIVQLIAEGRINKQISGRLDISIKTVETHRASAMHKLKLRTTADLVRYAIRNNIVLP